MLLSRVPPDLATIEAMPQRLAGGAFAAARRPSVRHPFRRRLALVLQRSRWPHLCCQPRRSLTSPKGETSHDGPKREASHALEVGGLIARGRWQIIGRNAHPL